MKSRIKPIKDIRKYHSSWIFACLSIGVIIGASLSVIHTDLVGLHWLVLGVCGVLVSLRNRRFLALILALVSGVLVGLWRGGIELSSQSYLLGSVDQEVIVTGKVSDDATYNTEGDIRFKLINVSIDGVNSAGSVWVSSEDKADIKRSDIVTVEGKVSEGFGSIATAVYRADILNITRQSYGDLAREGRDAFAEGIREGIREPEASLGSGFLLGQQSNLPEKLDNELRLLGLTHIVVASGYNLSILVRYARRLFEKVSRFTAVAMSFALVYGFANITGFSPSMTRASLITGLSLVAWYFGRKFHPVVLLSVSAAITVIVNPTYAWGDIGWLLSFTAFVGVILFSPLVHSYFWGNDKPGNIRQVFIETLSAQLLTMPIVIFIFGQYSPLALLANILILPLIPIAMVLTLIAGIGGLVAPGWASIIGWPAETLMGYMTRVIDYLAARPYAISEISITITALIVMYLIIFVTTIYLWRRTNHQFRDYNVIE